MQPFNPIYAFMAFWGAIFLWSAFVSVKRGIKWIMKG